MAVSITNWGQVFGKFTYNYLMVNSVGSEMGGYLWGFSLCN